MKKRVIFVWLAVSLCVLSLSNLSKAMESSSYAIKWSTIAGGSGAIQSASYAINATVGQASTGTGSSSSYQVGFGYWYGTVTRYAVYLPVVLKN